MSQHLHRLAAQAVDWVEVPQGSAEVPAGCLLDTLSMELTHVRELGARASMTVETVHLNQRGVVQGGALVAFADATAGWASYAAGAERFSTVSMSTSLAGMARAGDRLACEARLLHRGRTTFVITAEIHRLDEAGEPGKLVASFGCTQMVLASPEDRR